MKGRGSNQLVIGLIVIVIGVLFLLQSTDVLDVGDVFKWVPSLFILYALWLIVSSKFRSITGPLVIIAIAAIVQAGMLGVSVGDYWPVVLIVLGLAIIFSGSRTKLRRGEKHPGLDLNTINVTAVMSESQTRITAQDFRGGQVVSVMGSAEVDLRDAQVIERPARIDATVIMGGAEIKVPEGWVVRFDNLSIMGGSADQRKHKRTEPAADSKPDLTITGLVLMGGVEIKS